MVFPSESGTAESAFKYAHLLKFLDDVDTSKLSTSSSSEYIKMSEEQSEELESGASPPKNNDKFGEVMDAITKLVEMDECDHLGGLVACTLRKLSKNKRIEAKKKIMQLLFEMESED